MQKYPITGEGIKRMNEELTKLKNNDRPRIIQAIAEAKEQGDLSENAEYTAAKEEQGMIGKYHFTCLNVIPRRLATVTPHSCGLSTTLVSPSVSVRSSTEHPLWSWNCRTPVV